LGKPRNEEHGDGKAVQGPDRAGGGARVTGTGAGQNADAGMDEERVHKAVLLERLAKAVEQKVINGELKPTTADLLRVWQFEREFEGDQPKEVKVQWVEPPAQGTASEEKGTRRCLRSGDFTARRHGSRASAGRSDQGRARRYARRRCGWRM